MTFDFDYYPLFIVLGIAWLVPMLMSQLRLFKIPIVIVEIIAGFVIGKNVLNILPDEPYLDFLALTGFIFLMFLSGLEIDVNRILASFPRRRITYSRFLKNPFLVGLAIYVGTLLLSVAGAIVLSSYIEIANIWYFALIMSTSSVGVIFPVLKDRGEIAGRIGQMIILAAAVADILSILFFTFTASTLKNGLRFEVFLILTLFIAFFISYFIGKQLIKVTFFKRIMFQLAHAASQIKVRGTLALILLFLILSQLIDAEIILGAFLAGLLLSFFFSKDRSILLVKLDGMGYGFFIPIFFIMVGANLDLTALKEFDNSFEFLGVLLLTLYLVKILPSLIWTKLFGFRKAITGGFLLSSRLSLIIAAAQIGLQLNVITPAANAAIIIMAVVTCFISPIVYTLLNPLKISRSLKTVIVGGGEVGILLAKRLSIHGKSSVIVETNKKKYNELKQKGLDAVYADGKKAYVYNSIKLKPQNYVVILSGQEKENYEIASLLRKEFQHEKIITRTIDIDSETRQKILGIELVNVSETIATAIENLIIRPTTYHALFENFESFSVEDIIITNRKIDGMRVRDIPFHQEGELILIKRNNEMQIPHGDTELLLGDLVMVLGSETAIEDYREKFT